MFFENVTLRVTAEILVIISGVMVCALAVGNGVNMKEIENMSSPNCAFNLSSFTVLASSMRNAVASRTHHISSPTVDPDFFSGINFGKRMYRRMKGRHSRQ